MFYLILILHIEEQEYSVLIDTLSLNTILWFSMIKKLLEIKIMELLANSKRKKLMSNLWH